MKEIDCSSSFQSTIEKHLFKQVCAYLGEDTILRNKSLSLKSNPRIKINPDFYSEVNHILGEIHVHAGRLKGSQPHKIANDILKMLLFEKDSNHPWEKFIVVCDSDEYKQLTGESFLAETIRQFNIKVLLFPLDEKQHRQLIETMKKQNFWEH